MKLFWLFFLVILLAPIPSIASETKILYYQSKISGPQITKSYYIKESLKRVYQKNQNVNEVKTYTTVKSPEGTSEYRITCQLNCSEQKIKIVSYWSSGFGYDNGTIANGKWKNIANFEDSVALAGKICSMPKN